MDQRLRILIADDDHRARAGVRAFLSTTPACEVVGEAADGQEAIAQIAAHRPDAVLLDVRMPVLDGVQTTRIVKERWPEIRIVVFTLYPGHRAEALAAGADAYMSKADTPARLLEALQAVAYGTAPQADEY